MPAQLLKCIDLGTLPIGTGPNPKVIQSVKFRVFDFAGVPKPSTEIKAIGAFVGLDAGYRLEIDFPRNVKSVCMRLVHFAKPPKVLFVSPAGTTVGTVILASTQKVAQEVVGTSTAGINRIVVVPPSNETLLLSLCFG
jgi:hypothetical protein